ncbi:helix-turn-helix transcriptional regulator [Arthrobacter sp. NamB2]|uniref:helix-turn-helix transcriptional regulator n=1 Tax=Arthrobacter sp. NamB2 TaxID=2576035 RepID=UPI0016796F44|nr:WYL domain-containing protein [Arthrobacter sp. NamB2]
MWDTSERLLKLLSLLQRQKAWTSSALCKELSVTARTITRDITRLRNLGYPITTIKGVGGGYALQHGAALPPIMFSLDEATAVLLALRPPTTTGVGTGTSAGQDGPTAIALDKVHRALPVPLRTTLQVLLTHSTSIDLGQPITVVTPSTDPALLLLLARSCRDRRQVTCTYQHHNGTTRARRLEPLGLVHTMKRWYLVAYCTDDNDWATLRVDRITDATLTAHTAHARQPPAEDLDDYVAQAVSRGWRQVTATVRVHAPAADISHWVSPAWGDVTEETPSTCIVHAGADTYDSIARWLLLTTAEITIITPPDLAHAFDRIAAQALRTTTTTPHYPSD